MCKQKCSQHAQICQSRMCLDTCPFQLVFEKKQNSWVTYSHMIYQKHWVPYRTNLKDPQLTHRVRGKKWKRKVVVGLAIVEDHGLPCNANWSLKMKFVPVHW